MYTKAYVSVILAVAFATAAAEPDRATMRPGLTAGAQARAAAVELNSRAYVRQQAFRDMRRVRAGKRSRAQVSTAPTTVFGDVDGDLTVVIDQRNVRSIRQEGQ